jgi:hypothetical protein
MQWYVHKGLADFVEGDDSTIKLKFRHKNSDKVDGFLLFVSFALLLFFRLSPLRRNRVAPSCSAAPRIAASASCLSSRILFFGRLRTELSSRRGGVFESKPNSSVDNAQLDGGVDSFYAASKVNECVVCGERGHYLRYRIVPSCYRRFFPTHLKSHRSHDIVLVCLPCHEVCRAPGASSRIPPRFFVRSSIVTADFFPKTWRAALRDAEGSTVRRRDKARARS